jgi:hypothetical protein
MRNMTRQPFNGKVTTGSHTKHGSEDGGCSRVELLPVSQQIQLLHTFVSQLPRVEETSTSARPTQARPLPVRMMLTSSYDFDGKSQHEATPSSLRTRTFHNEIVGSTLAQSHTGIVNGVTVNQTGP